MRKASHVVIERMPRVILVKSAAAITTNHVTKLQATSGLGLVLTHDPTSCIAFFNLLLVNSFQLQRTKPF